MLLAGLSLKGFAIEASDGRIGTVGDFLFDDSTWHVRWMVINTGSWLTGRTVLVHPSAIGRADHKSQKLVVRLTRAEVEKSPDILLDEPASRQIEYGEHHCPGWDPAWGNPRYVAGFWGGIGIRVSRERLAEEKSMLKRPRGGGQTDDGDPHLRSVSAITGNHVHCTDGLVGHVQDVLLDDADWNIRAIIVDTEHWRPGKHLMVPPSAIRDISWPRQDVRLNISSHETKESPTWTPTDVVD